MRTIYCDMDGVLSNFNARYETMFKKKPSEVARNGKEGEYSKSWNTFIDSRQFSTGGFDRHNNVMIQKRIWLENRGINWPFVFVPGRRFKAGYADKYSLMIDDTFDVIESFQKNGGAAIHHKDAKTTIEQIKQWMEV